MVKRFFGFSDEDEDIVKAWKLFIDVRKGVRDLGRDFISPEEYDRVQAEFIAYMREKELEILDWRHGLRAGEMAITKLGEREGIKTLNSLDIMLMLDFSDVCAALVADDPRKVEGFPRVIAEFLDNPNILPFLKERLIERDKEATERLLKAFIEARPDSIEAHQLLIEIYKREGRFSEMEAEYKRILSKNEDELVWMDYGAFLERKGAYEEALRAFKRSFEICQTKIRAKTSRSMILSSISRVERLMKLKGEDAEKAKECIRAAWLIDEIRKYAGRELREWIKEAANEYLEERGLYEMSEDDLVDFSNWFLFQREFAEGKTPAMIYAEEKGLDEETKKKIEGLGKPVTAVFEVIEVDHDAFKLKVRSLIGEEEYELRADVPQVKKGQTFEGNIYPWGDMYISGGSLKIHTPEFSEKIKELARDFRDGRLVLE